MSKKLKKEVRALRKEVAELREQLWLLQLYVPFAVPLGSDPKPPWYVGDVFPPPIQIWSNGDQVDDGIFCSC